VVFNGVKVVLSVTTMALLYRYSSNQRIRVSKDSTWKRLPNAMPDRDSDD